MNIIFIGDIVGFSGFDFVCKELPQLKEKYNASFIVVNGENICHGKGITDSEASVLFNIGVDVITTGNHIWDNWASKSLLKSDKPVIRPFNYPPGNVGRGFVVVKHKTLDIEIAVIQLQGRAFMSPIDCPFRGADYILKHLPPHIKIIIVDFHAEATGEKVTMGKYLDGRVSAVCGTHTHIQTADAQILEKGTAYITDVGMSGAYDSVVGLRKDVSLSRYIYQIAHKYEPATEDNKICGAVINIDENTSKTTSIQNFIFPEFSRNIHEGI